jgi:hypothetical protein
MCASGLPPFSRKRCSQQALADRLEVHSGAPVFPWFARPVLRRLKTGTDAAVLADRGVEDVAASCCSEEGSALDQLNKRNRNGGKRINRKAVTFAA